MERYAESNEYNGNNYEAMNMCGTASPNHDYNLSDITRNLRETFGLGRICAAAGCGGRGGIVGSHIDLLNNRDEIFPCLVPLCNRHNHHTNTNPIPLRSGVPYRRLYPSY